MEYVPGGDLYHGFHAMDEEIVAMKEQIGTLKRQLAATLKLMEEFELNRKNKTEAEKEQNFQRMLSLNSIKQELGKKKTDEKEKRKYQILIFLCFLFCLF